MAFGTTILVGGIVFAGVVTRKTRIWPRRKRLRRAPRRRNTISAACGCCGIPAMRGFTGATFTKEEPELTDWGKQKYAEAKNSNGGKFTLETTNDPVLTRCAPPGTPRVYFHPYPFEFVTRRNTRSRSFEYDHTIRRIFTDGRPCRATPTSRGWALPWAIGKAIRPSSWKRSA